MSYFSPFWYKHYKGIGTCCITYPMEKDTVLDTMGKKLVSFIDVGWMFNEKLKWIGHDWDGYFAWITPNGMILRFKDLKRNEAGEKYEKEVRKLEIYGDGFGHDPQFSNKHDFYMWEYESQINCDFCPKDASGKKGKGKNEEEEDEEEKNEDGGTVNDDKKDEWKKYTTDNTDEEKKRNNAIDTTDDEDTTYTKHITNSVVNYEEENTIISDYSLPKEEDDNSYTQYIKKEEKEENRQEEKPKEEKLNRIIILQEKKVNPVLNTQKVLNNKKVTDTKITLKSVVDSNNIADSIFKKQKVAKIDNLRVKSNIPPEEEQITFPKPSKPIKDANEWFKQSEQKGKTRNINESEIDPGYYKASVNSRMIGFLKRHPIAATSIGLPERGSTNISNNAVRFSTRIGLLENSDKEGSQVNAFRHALWQATITNEFGQSIAKQIGNAHEKNPFAVSNSKPKTSFNTLAEADETIDLMNNVIGRDIGAKITKTDMNIIALKTLDYFYQHGLWTATPTTDSKGKVIKYTISKNRLNYNQYNEAKRIIQRLNKNGFTEQEQINRDMDAQANIDRLNRGPKI